MKNLNKYIDVCIIDEYVKKDFLNGWDFDISILPDTEADNLIDLFLQEDVSVRDLVLSHIEDIIRNRAADRELEERAACGLTLKYLSNGDTRIQREANYYV